MKTIAIFIAVAFMLWPRGIGSSETAPKQNIQDYMLPAVKAEIVLPISSVEIQKKPIGLVGNGQCIDYIKYRLNAWGEKWKTAENFWNNYQEFGFILVDEPVVGAILVTDEGPVWHVALIEEVTQESIRVSEQNYVYRKYSERTLERNADQIQGYLVMTNHQPDELLPDATLSIAASQISDTDK